MLWQLFASRTVVRPINVLALPRSPPFNPETETETETPKGVVKGSCIEQLTMTAILPLRAEENGGPKPAPKRAKQAKERTTKSKKPTTATTGLNKSRSAKGSS